MRGLLVADHLVLQADQNFLHGVLWIPVLEHVESFLHITVGLVNAWEVDFGSELDQWSFHWVIVSANDVHHVDPVVKVGVWWPNDSAIPLGEGLVITFINWLKIIFQHYLP